MGDRRRCRHVYLCATRLDIRIIVVGGHRGTGSLLKRRFSLRGDLPTGQLVALNGEAAIKAKTCSPWLAF
jgi:hypothetical protein